MWWIFPLLLASFFFLFYLHRKAQQRFFKNLGIPGPKPNWLFGSLLCYNNSTHPQVLWIKQNTKKYGKIWGFFEGPKPVLVVAEPELVQEVCIKQFSSFHSRKLMVLQEKSDSPEKVSMFNADGDRWKRLRTIVNPAFSEFKMRQMFPLMKKCIDVLMSQFSEQSAKKEFFDAYKYYKRLTLEVIGECAFGTSLNVQQNEDRPILTKIKLLFESITRRPFLVLMAEAIPELAVLVRKLFAIFAPFIAARRATSFIQSTIAGVIKMRKKDPSLRRTDILQLMLDAEETDGTGRKSLTKHEVNAQSLIFLAAGYETSSTALGIITHVLANHPEVQERIQAEIDSLYEYCDDPSSLEESSEHLTEMEYLNNVINEILRYYPIAPHAVSRTCMSPIKVAGYTIPAGTYVMSDVLTIHFDPAVWGPIDPQIFDPDRFEGNPKRAAASFLTFGTGPRFCIGQRFALTEIRAVLFRLLRRFSIRGRTKTLKLRYRPTVSPAGSVDVLLEPRNLD